MIKSQEDISKKTSEPVRYRITATLLNSWQYIYDAEDIYYTDDEEKGISAEDKLAAEKEKRYQSFLDTLERKPQPDTEIFKRGREFEDRVCKGNDPVFSKYVKGGAFQVKAYKELEIQGLPITLFGILDVLKNGRIMDIKRVTKYTPRKYKTSHQHSMYMYLVPEGLDFTYLIADDNIESPVVEKRKNGYHLEHYERYNCEDIVETVEKFLSFLKAKGLLETFKQKWIMNPNYIKNIEKI